MPPRWKAIATLVLAGLNYYLDLVALTILVSVAGWDGFLFWLAIEAIVHSKWERER